MFNKNLVAENESAQTAQMSANVVANTTANENTKSMGKQKGKPNNPPKKRKPIPPMWRVLGKARKTFDVQLSMSNEVKLECITRNLGHEFHDIAKFWGDYFEQVAKLLDSRRYVVECTNLGYDAVNVAEHIVFLGSTDLNKVLKNGVLNTLGNKVRFYTGRLTPLEYTDKLRKDMYDFSGVKEKTVAETAGETTSNVTEEAA